jgi:hypothetical protein
MLNEITSKSMKDYWIQVMCFIFFPEGNRTRTRTSGWEQLICSAVFKNKKRPWQTSHSLFFTAHTVFYLGPAGCAWAKCWSPRPGKLEGSSLVSTPVYQVHFTFKNLFPKTHICFNKFCLSELTKRCTGQWKTLVRWWNRSW